MSQRRVSRYEATRVSENAAHSEQMSQHIKSIDEATHVSENAADAERMSQNIESRDEATCASENEYHYGKRSEPIGRFTVVLVGDFQQLPPVGETSMYQPDDSPGTLAYYVFKNVVILHESHHHAGQEDQYRSFQKILSLCEAGTLEAEDWNVLKTCFIQNSPDASDPKWDDAPHLFHDKNIIFKYNMSKLKDIGTQITPLNA